MIFVISPWKTKQEEKAKELLATGKTVLEVSL